MTNLVGLCGRAGSGKSLVADKLEEMGYERLRFSEALKNMMRAMYATWGVSPEEIERRIEGDLKEVPDQLLGGKTPRYAMQTLGKEWGRDLISDTLWSKGWRAKADQMLAEGRKIVAEDVRFETEDFEIHDIGGKVVEITGRAKGEVAASHPSEQLLGVYVDFELQNTGTIAELRGAVEYVFRDAQEHEVAA